MYVKIGINKTTDSIQGHPKDNRCHIVGDLKRENGNLEDFYYYMFYFIGDFNDFFATRNRPPCNTKAKIEVNIK